MKTIILSSIAAGLALAASLAMASDPIPGVDVKLGRNPGGIIAHATTGADGTFVFGDLAAGRYQLSISPAQTRGMINTTRSNIKHQNIGVTGGVQVVTISAQLGAQAVAGEIEITAVKGRISGTVTRADAAPAGGPASVPGTAKKATGVGGLK